MFTAIHVKKEEEDRNAVSCKYVLSRGGRGERICGAKIKNGTDYCASCAKKNLMQDVSGPTGSWGRWPAGLTGPY